MNRLIWIALAAVLLCVGCARRAVRERADLYVPTGASYRMLLDSLEGKVADTGHMPRVQPLRPGRYVLEPGMSYRAIGKMIERGLQRPVRLTFNNIRTLDRLAGTLARQTEPDSLAWLATLTDAELIDSLGFTPQTLLAMFIPDSYEVYWNSSPERLAGRMKREYDRFWNGERLARLEATGLSQIEVSVLASIVYEETKMSDEMPRVAGVYINRLRTGMPLQADPTVKFAVGDPTIRRVLNRHLEVDSPYNTYRYRGLPPGPICMPSIRAIDAVLGFEKHDYLYFCAAPDFSGYHRFARNLAAHNRNAQAYAAALDRAGIRR